MEQRSDAELAVASRKGDEGAFAELVKRYLAPVYRFAFRLMGEGDAAEDVSQETFIKAWRKLSTFNSSKSFRTWILSIAYHAAIDAIRKKSPIPFTRLESENESWDAQIPDSAPLPDEMLERSETAAAIESAMTELSPSARAAVLLHESQGMTFEEIAATMGEPMNTVKSRYRRALNQLSEILRKTL